MKCAADIADMVAVAGEHVKITAETILNARNGDKQ